MYYCWKTKYWVWIGATIQFSDIENNRCEQPIIFCSDLFVLCLTEAWIFVAGFSLFLGFLIDRMHHYLQKLNRLRGTAGASKEEFEKLQKERSQLKQKDEQASKEIKLLQEQISTLTQDLKKLKLEAEEKDKTIETAEAHVISLQKQSADLLLEYDRLLEDNQNLQTQALGFRS